MEGELNGKKRAKGGVLRLVPLLVEAIVSSCPSVRNNKAEEEESISFLQGPMHRVTNYRNVRNGMMESFRLLVVYLPACGAMAANTRELHTLRQSQRQLQCFEVKDTFGTAVDR